MNCRLAVTILAVAFSLLTSAECGADEPAAAEKAADAMLGKEPGQVRDGNGLKMKLVWCPPGFLTMGQVERISGPAVQNSDKLPDDDDVVDSKDEPAPDTRASTKIISWKVTPVKVFLTKGYWLAKFEVTQSEWKKLMATEPWKGQLFAKEGDDIPATCVAWDEAMEFCRTLTKQERKAGRLPADWEFTLPSVCVRFVGSFSE
jgi:formylglycine-generating enzyme required for sulfatase activity